jgi:site-specific DNA recombinase
MRVGVYARVSSDRQKEEQTIRSQLEEIHTFAAEHGWPVEQRHIYVDEACSGYYFDRPGLDRLRDAARDGLLDLILVHDPDRLARRYAYQVLLLEELQRWGVAVRFLKQPPADSPDQRLLVQVQAAIAEYERARIQERTRRGRLFWARQGRPVSAKVPFGYRYVPRSQARPPTTEVDASEATVVQKIFHWYAEARLTPRQIALRLTAEGVPTPLGRNSYWDPSSIRLLLRCEAYLGNWFLNRHRADAEGPSHPRRKQRPREEWIPVPVPALIERALFAKAQQLRRERQQDPNYGGRPLRHHDTHLLRRLVVCAFCGYKMTSSSSNAGRGHRYYWCRGPDPRGLRADRPRCPHPTIQAEHLDDLVWSDLVAVLTDPNLLLMAWRQQQGKPGLRHQEVIGQEVRGLDKQIADAQTQRQRLLIAYEQGAIELKELVSRREILERKVEELRRRLDSISRESEKGATLAELGKDIEAVCEALATGLERMRKRQRMELCRKLIERVVVDEHSAEIHYRFPVSSPCNRRGVPAGVLLPDPQSLPQLPRQARGVVRGIAGHRGARAGPAPPRGVHHPQSAAWTVRAGAAAVVAVQPLRARLHAAGGPRAFRRSIVCGAPKGSRAASRRSLRRGRGRAVRARQAWVPGFTATGSTEALH